MPAGDQQVVAQVPNQRRGLREIGVAQILQVVDVQQDRHSSAVAQIGEGTRHLVVVPIAGPLRRHRAHARADRHAGHAQGAAAARVALSDRRDLVPESLRFRGRLPEPVDACLALRGANLEQGAEHLRDERMERRVVEHPDRLLMRERAAGGQAGLEGVDEARLAHAGVALDDHGAARPGADRRGDPLQLRRAPDKKAAGRVERVIACAEFGLEERVALQAVRRPAVRDRCAQGRAGGRHERVQRVKGGHLT